MKNINIEWINTQCKKNGISKKRLANDLGLDYKGLINLLSPNGRNQLNKLSQKSRFYYYFQTIELKKELRLAKLKLDLKEGLINEAKYNFLISLDDKLLNKQSFTYDLQNDTEKNIND